MGWSHEFKVGLFVLFGAGAIVAGGIWSVDGVWFAEKVYRLNLTVPSADGLYIGTPVKLAGVEIGSIDTTEVRGNSAQLVLTIREEYAIPADSTAEIRSAGIIGDRYIGVDLGDSAGMMKDGDRIELKELPADFQKITRQVDTITEDIQAITKVLRQMVEQDSNRENIEATMMNVRLLSEEMRMIAHQNHEDINAIVDSVRRLASTLEVVAADTQGDLNDEMEKIKETTDSLKTAADDIESITGKIDEGQGTIGALVNDRETIDLINDTVSNVNSLVRGVSGLRTAVYYTGRFYFGSDPKDTQTFFFGNPLANTGSNTVGIRLMPQEDFWYNFEINDYPIGTINYTEHFFPETGQVYTEYVREPNYRFTFQMNKRFWNLGVRLGIKEGGGGFGASYWLFKDKLEFSADVFDFDLGSYPAVEAAGIPNIRLLVRYQPIEHVYVEAGAEQMFLGIKYGYATGFAGAGFTFNDDDIKLLLSSLPLNF